MVKGLIHRSHQGYRIQSVTRIVPDDISVVWVKRMSEELVLFNQWSYAHVFVLLVYCYMKNLE